MRDGLSDLADLFTAADRDELWEILLVYPGPRTSYHGEAVQLLRRHHEDGTPDALTTAQLLCTDGRWEPCTGRLMRGIEETRILSDGDIGELADSFLWPDHLTFYRPLGWSGSLVAIDVGGVAGETSDSPSYLDPDTPVPVKRRIPPPLRRWAAERLLRADSGAFEAICARALEAEILDGSAILSGVLDAIDALDEGPARQAIDLGLGWPRGQVRLTALDLLADRDLDAARLRADVDPDRKVRAWIPRHERASNAARRRARPRPRRSRRHEDPDDLEFAWFELRTLPDD